MTLTAMRPDSGLGNGREVAFCSVAQASLSISALRVVLSDLCGSPAPRKQAWRTREFSWLLSLSVNQQATPSGPSLRTSPVLGWNTSTPLTVACSQLSASEGSRRSSGSGPQRAFESVGHPSNLGRLRQPRAVLFLRSHSQPLRQEQKRLRFGQRPTGYPRKFKNSL